MDNISDYASVLSRYISMSDPVHLFEINCTFLRVRLYFDFYLITEFNSPNEMNTNPQTDCLV